MAGPSNGDRMVEVYLWGDSHLTNRHHVSGILAGELGPRYPLINNACGGKIFDRAFLDNFRNFLLRDNPNPSFHVISLGGNNIRKEFRRGAFTSDALRQERANQEVLLLVEHYRALFEIVSNVPKTKVCVILPFPSQHKEHEPFFEKLSLYLEQLSREYGQFFVDVRDKLSDTSVFQDGLKLRSWSQQHFKDDVHLNEQGGRMVALEIKRKLVNIPREVFGLQAHRLARHRQFVKSKVENLGRSLSN